MTAKVKQDDPVRRHAEPRTNFGLKHGGEVILANAGDATSLLTIAEVVAQAQALSRKLLAGHAGVSLADFLAERHRDAETE